MKLAIFGATGRTGMPLVEQALEAGYEVVALIRTPEKLTMHHPHLMVIQGDALQRADVERTIKGVDTVISVLGPSKQSPKGLLTGAMRNIIAAMEKYGVKRLVVLTGAGVQAPQDKPRLMNHVIKTLLKLMSGAVLKDSEEEIRLVRESQLDWVVVRGPMLNAGPRTGNYRVGWVGINTGARISRADVADFMLKQVTNSTYVRQMPMISD